ncbi:hypothetical protein QE374_002799 [Microbacterium sp. SORGH_AS428]|uniref:hypothetical protein n=1 Tax=Microbacterium sp. SORGH_AS_0428 TaxID=3041788 RepID=UPI002859BCC8|nr:hypothetical protein [Microbacterium sp. SORGH_AS_0428]MDR6200890.1 hypothetical protein [Microbacterium sp. SORGH_AS_0428]
MKLGDMLFEYDATNLHSRTTYGDGVMVKVERDALGRIATQQVVAAGTPTQTTSFRPPDRWI